MDTETGDAEELVTLRTRSMADVLAEQGDLAGALEIYQELETAAPTPEEAALLRERVVALAARVSEEPEKAPLLPKDAESAPVDDAAVPASSSKMLTLLETLADRLEARAHA